MVVMDGVRLVRIEDHLYAIPAEPYEAVLETCKPGDTPAWRHVLNHGRIVHTYYPGDADYFMVDMDYSGSNNG